MTNKPNSRLVNDRHHETTDDHGNKIPNISVNLQTNSTKDISTKSQERYIKTDTKLVSLQREMRLNENTRYNFIDILLPHGYANKQYYYPHGNANKHYSLLRNGASHRWIGDKPHIWSG